MKSVEILLRDNLLEGDAARAFDTSRERVHHRHANWRASFPAIGALLDDDTERAQALAGNWATEAREIVGVWLSAQEGTAVAGTQDQRAAWVRDFWGAWRAEVFARDDVAALEGAPRERFVHIFDDLMTRFRDEAAAFVQHDFARLPAPRLAERLTAPARTVGRVLRGFFFPSVRR